MAYSTPGEGRAEGGAKQPETEMTIREVLSAAQQGQTEFLNVRITGRADSGQMRGLRFYRCNLSGVIIDGVIIAGCEFAHCNMRAMVMVDAYIVQTRLIGCDLSRLKTTSAYLRNVLFDMCEQVEMTLDEARLHMVDFVDCNMARIRMCRAQTADVVFIRCNLHLASLREADLSGADFRMCGLSEADLSGATGLLNPSDWMKENFEADGRGYIVYKAIGHTKYAPPDHWEIRPGAVLTETVNPDPTTACGCGVNFGTKDWISGTYEAQDNETRMWRCRIAWEDLPSVVVPYDTLGKARCARLTLLNSVSK